MANLDENFDPSAQQYSPSAGAAAPSGEITLAPGYTPDYGDLFSSSPVLAAAKSASDANQEMGAAARTASVRDRYVKYGGDVPAGWTDRYGDLDQATKDAAKGNQFSTIANLHNDYSKSVENFKKALSARGQLQSSELDYGQDALDRGYGQQQYDAANAFTGGVAGDYSTYAGVLGQNARDLASAAGTAESNLYANPANRPVPPTQAHYDSTSSAKYGKAVYADAWGTLYDQFGNVIVQGTPPEQTTTQTTTGGGGSTTGTEPTVYPGGAPTATAEQAPMKVAAPFRTSFTLPSQDFLDNTALPTRELQSIGRRAFARPSAPASGYSYRSSANLH